MPNTPPDKWRPLTLCDVAYLTNIKTDALKKRARFGRFCPPRWVSTGEQRLWAFGDLERWARDHGVTLRPLAQLDRVTERVRRSYGWETVA
jgi:hypothetical protein